jgi:hypothetical protein
MSRTYIFPQGFLGDLVPLAEGDVITVGDLADDVTVARGQRRHHGGDLFYLARHPHTHLVRSRGVFRNVDFSAWVEKWPGGGDCPEYRLADWPERLRELAQIDTDISVGNPLRRARAPEHELVVPHWSETVAGLRWVEEIHDVISATPGGITEFTARDAAQVTSQLDLYAYATNAIVESNAAPLPDTGQYGTAEARPITLAQTLGVDAVTEARRRQEWERMEERLRQRLAAQPPGWRETT